MAKKESFEQAMARLEEIVRMKRLLRRWNPVKRRWTS